MRLLGEDKEFDQLMLTNSAVKSALKTKGSSRSKSNAQHLKELVRIPFLSRSVESNETES